MYPSRGRGSSPRRGMPSDRGGPSSRRPPSRGPRGPRSSRGPQRPQSQQRDLSAYQAYQTFDNVLEPTHGEVRILGDSEFVKRPGYYRNGIRCITLISNHYKIKLKEKQMVVYHYDVTIKTLAETEAVGRQREKKTTKEQNRTIMNELIRSESNPGGIFYGDDGRIATGFDGMKNLYSREPLGEIGIDPDSKVVRVVSIPNNEYRSGRSSHEVTIAIAVGEDAHETQVNFGDIERYYTGQSDTFPLEAIQILNTFMRKGPLNRCFSVGVNSLYANGVERKYLGKGITFQFGRFQSIRPVAAGLSIVLDRTATAFYYEGTAVDFLRKLLEGRNGEGTDQDIVDLMNPRNYSRTFINYDLSKVHFYTMHCGYKKRYNKFNELSFKPAQSLTFETENGTQKTVEQYLRETYNIRLKYPHFPCMDFGTETKHNYIPPELCFVVENQHVKELLKADQNSELIRATANPPSQRFLEIQEAACNLKQECTTPEDYLMQFDIDMELKPIRAVGKILQPPTLVYGNKTIKPAAGKWDMRDTKVYRGVRIQKWAIYDMTRFGEEKFGDFINGLCDMARRMGIQMAEALDSQIIDRPIQIRDYIQKLVENGDRPELVVWIQRKDDALREKVKQLCEVSIPEGILSQCILDNVYGRANQQVYANILLKINTKLGGINHILQNLPSSLTSKDGVIILGADVTHSAPANALDRSLTDATGGVRFEASVAAVVGTMDKNFVTYYTEVKVQRKERSEMITDLRSMFTSIVKQYYLKNGKTLPQTIIFYRDGVSEGQFRAVLDYEISQMENACDDIAKNTKRSYKPKITFIIVQKRHHTRIRPQNESDGVGRMNNVPPGTLVDTCITHPRDFDYFLASHEGIQGTSRPSHYYVLRDDSNFKEEAIIEMTYYLCHTYAKSTRSVSFPAPAYYAHLAAFRARNHIGTATAMAERKLQRPNPDETAEERNARFSRCVAMLNQKIQIQPRLKHYMYFC